MSRKRTPAKAKPSKAEEIRVLARNRRARHEFTILETFEAGVALTGTEVKAAREGSIQLKDSYVEVRDEEAWLLRVQISPYSHGNIQNHLPERPRKLLLRRHQINKIFGRTQLKGKTVVPLSMYLKGPWVKAEIALVEGKKLYDKRQAERQKTLDKEAREAMKPHRF